MIFNFFSMVYMWRPTSLCHIYNCVTVKVLEMLRSWCLKINRVFLQKHKLDCFKMEMLSTTHFIVCNYKTKQNKTKLSKYRQWHCVLHHLTQVLSIKLYKTTQTNIWNIWIITLLTFSSQMSRIVSRSSNDWISLKIHDCSDSM